MDNDRQIIHEIEDYLNNYMEDIFNDTCRNIQKDWLKGKRIIQEELIQCFKNAWQKTIRLQDSNQKGKVKYWLISIQRSSLLWDQIAFRIETFDDGFFLDSGETAEEYLPGFLKTYWDNDMNRLSELLGKKFVRLQKYQYDVARDLYAVYFYSIVYQFLKNKIEGILEGICLCSDRICTDYKVIFGYYMGHGTILYEGEKI